MASSSYRSRNDQSTNIKQALYNALMKEDWRNVVTMFGEHPEIHSIKIAEMMPKKERPSKTGDQYESDTALHWAITYKADELTVAKLVYAIKSAQSPNRALKILKSKNKRGDTPLHCAASRGSTLICIAITDIGKSLVVEHNKNGETPIFLAAFHGHQSAFLFLHSICKEHDPTLSPSIWQRNNGDTILHCTIRRKYLGLSYEIIRQFKDQNVNIGSYFNEGGKLPLDEIVSIPSAFKNCYHLTWWQRLCYCFIYVEGPDSDRRNSRNSTDHRNLLESLRGQLDPLMNQISSNTASEQTGTNWSHSQVDQGITSNSNDEQSVSSFSPVFAMKLKKDHKLSDRIIDELVKQDPWYKEKDHAMEVQNIENNKYYPEKDMEIQGGRIKISTALLIAAKNGLVKQVRKILDDIPVSIHDKLLEEKKNIVHVAIEERQSHVLEEVKKRKHWLALREKLDAEGNNALHLAAKQSKYTANGIRGLVMQMQWEIMWFEYVKECMPPYFISQPNNKGETPGEIFTKEHMNLINDCDNSMKDTCGSYMIASTLVTGSAFSACFQQDIDIFGHTFSISLFISFLFSISSLATFLAIYLSRKEQPNGFRTILPLKISWGIISFLASLISLSVSFYAALSHDFHPKAKYKPMFISYVVILLPVAVIYIFTQLPLYWHLFKSSVTKVPDPRIVEEENISGFFQDLRTAQYDHYQPTSVRDGERENRST